jgi:hypothetical protein
MRSPRRLAITSPGVAGKIPYGKHSPRYQLDSDGVSRLHRHFDDGQNPPSPFQLHLRGQLRKSAIYRAFERFEPRTNDGDVRLMLATVYRSRDLLVADYPGIQFHVNLWRNFDYEQSLYRQLQKGFAQMNVPVHLAEDVLPDYNQPRTVLASGGRPTPERTCEYLFARYVVTRLLSARPNALRMQ